MNLDKQCADANSRGREYVNRSSAQHLRAMRAPIVETPAEREYAKPLHGYVDLDQSNHDGTSPHLETRDLVELALDGALVVFVVAMLIFTVFSLLGFLVNKS